jgi:alpha-N-arabinofuranosidase
VSDLTNVTFGTKSIVSRSVADSWTQHTYTLHPKSGSYGASAKFILTFDAKVETSLDFNLISLFPPTYKNRENGLRIDLFEGLQRLKPSFMRFPGGNNL